MAHIDTKHLGFDTKLIHAGGHHDAYGSATVPIYQTSTFAFDNAQQGADRFAGTADGYIYTRLGNPTINALERQMAELEGGFAGIATSSGMGAVSTVYMALLDQGAHIVGTASVYGPSRLLAEKHLSRFGVESSWVDTTNLDNLRRAMRPTTRIVYTESVANPTMDVTDIRGAADIAHEHGALLVVDNTFCSPYLHRPIELGADVVLHCVTKFLNGHADVVGGVVVAKTEALYRKLRPMMWMSFGCIEAGMHFVNVFVRRMVGDFRQWQLLELKSRCQFGALGRRQAWEPGHAVAEGNKSQGNQRGCEAARRFGLGRLWVHL